MKEYFMDEREFELINIVGKRIASSQRDLSREMDLSLGAINMLLRRLVSKGFIRVEQLDRRKVAYILTPQGFSEKMQKSVKYTVNTIKSIGLIKKNLKDILTPLLESGHRHFYILGKSDLTILIEGVFRESGLEDYQLDYLHDIPEEPIDGVVLICRENVSCDDFKNVKSVNLIEQLSANVSVRS